MWQRRPGAVFFTRARWLRYMVVENMHINVGLFGFCLLTLQKQKLARIFYEQKLPFSIEYPFTMIMKERSSIVGSLIHIIAVVSTGRQQDPLQNHEVSRLPYMSDDIQYGGSGT